MFKQHLEMIGRNETPSKKAKFWQSYVRSLKGSDDIRAHETPKSGGSTWRSDFSPAFKSIYDEPSTASERISGAGYRYLPVHRETYGYSPRAIYSHHYNRPASTYENNRYDAEKAWTDHLERMKEIERRYPSRYGLYLKDKPSSTVVPLEYEPEDKPIRSGSIDRGARATSVPPLSPSFRASSVPPFSRGARASSLAPLDSLLSEYDRPLTIGRQSPTPVKLGQWGPRDSEVAFDADGLPIYRNSWSPYNSLSNLFAPSRNLPMLTTRDPFLYELPYLRDSYLSPINRSYLWNRHPIRPYAHNF